MPITQLANLMHILQNKLVVKISEKMRNISDELAAKIYNMAIKIGFLVLVLVKMY